jgi:hypothetical protein
MRLPALGHSVRGTIRRVSVHLLGANWRKRIAERSAVQTRQAGGNSCRRKHADRLWAAELSENVDKSLRRCESDTRASVFAVIETRAPLLAENRDEFE